MAGHGLLARKPTSVLARPFDAAAFASEPSPVAGVTLDEAGDRLVGYLRRIGQGRPVVVVGHSMGGPIIQRAAQQAPELVAHLVYLTAFMPASGLPVAAYADTPEFREGSLAPAFIGDAATVGALRIDPTSPDPTYRAALRQCFYDDVDQATSEAAISLLSTDGPAGLVAGVTELTATGWGALPRTYVACENDFALRPALQRRFVAEADTAWPDNPTRVVELPASHSPFLSMPDRVAEIIAAVS
jgi:pimeloyl-ACP methyl ester carboxylesterase